MLSEQNIEPARLVAVVKRQILGCSLRSAHGKDSLKFGLFDKFIRIAIKLEKQDGGIILHSVA